MKAALDIKMDTYGLKAKQKQREKMLENILTRLNN